MSTDTILKHPAAKVMPDPGRIVACQPKDRRDNLYFGRDGANNACIDVKLPPIES